MSRFFRPGWIVIYVVIIGTVLWFLGGIMVYFSDPLVVEEGDNLTSILSDQGWLDGRRIRRAASTYDFDPAKLAVGTYGDIVGSMSVDEFYTLLAAGPSATYERVTILEGWSIYDTDSLLAEKGWIRAGDYVDYVTDTAVIREMLTKHSFLEILPNERSSLEGFLYPETYYIDRDYALLPQLVGLQLQAFYDAIWLPLGNDILDASRWQSVGLSPYDMLIMASVVLKEERNEDYQSLVSGVFLNRLQSEMRLDADITLCYGLAEPYDFCTPSVIVQYLSDASNPYNTRALKGLPPTPISSLTPAVVEAVITVSYHDYLYYLHDNRGVIHPALTYEEHLYNKNKYLQ